jgi:predicted transcriptional regulator
LSDQNESAPSKNEPQSKAHKFRNRNRMEIVANLLEIARTGALKTHLMYRANLSYLMVTEYLQYLSTSQLIEETVDEEGVTKIYRTSPKGLKYLQVYDSLQSIAGLDSLAGEKTSKVNS